MQEMYKKAFDKMEMNENNKNEIRSSLLEMQESKRTNIPVWMKSSIAAAILVGVLLCVPTTRTLAANVLEYVIGAFQFSDGSEVSVEYNDTGDEVSVAVTMDVDEQSYVEVVDERIYFIYGDIKKDVTNHCSETEYYEHEVIDEGGNRHMIFVGGTSEAAGWVELLFDADGNYITNRMCVPSPCLAWAELAMDAAGVPTGNPELDKEFMK